MNHRSIALSLRCLALRLTAVLCLSSLLIFASAPWAGRAQAHELFPAIADVTVTDDQLTVSIRLNIEAVLAGIDRREITNANDSAQSDEYDRLRRGMPDQIINDFIALWPDFKQRLVVLGDGEPLKIEIDTVSVPLPGDPALPRPSDVAFSAAVGGTTAVQVGWDAALGPLVVRQKPASDTAYAGYLTNGQLSEPFGKDGAADRGVWAVIADYIVIGFEHILPKGLDHILFVLGLFFLSQRLRPLLIQVTAFTVAHTITLALGISGVVVVVPEIVEPLIAASIVYVAVENILTPRLTPWRPIIVVLFGLLHGLGFASVLSEIGLPPGQFATALISFNVGVELGQLAVIAMAFAAVGYWFGDKPWYRRMIAIPASAVIALIGAWWCIERTIL